MVHTPSRAASGLRVPVNKEDHHSNITIGLQLKMTSGTNILSASEKLQLPVVAGTSAALSKFSLRAALSCGKTQVWVSSPPSPCHYPGATAGDGRWPGAGGLAALAAPWGLPHSVCLPGDNFKCTSAGWPASGSVSFGGKGAGCTWCLCWVRREPPCDQGKLLGSFLPQCPRLRWEQGRADPHGPEQTETCSTVPSALLTHLAFLWERPLWHVRPTVP